MRLLKARRGDFTGADPAPASFTAAAGTQRYQYDFVGNIRSTELLARVDENGPANAADRKLTGSFNAVNEQTNYVEQVGGGGSLGATFAITHDAAGNVRTRETVAGGNRLAYRHDRWGRLTEVKFEVRSGSSYLANDRARYRYNALGMRALVERDADTTDGNNTINERRYLYYNAAWQIVEEHVDAGVTDSSPLSIDRIVQNVWGLRYIDDLVLRRVDANYPGSGPPSFAETASGDIDWEQYLTDHQFSVVAAVGRTGTLAFRIAYDAYGEARHLPAKDINGDGKVDKTDTTLAQGAVGKKLGQPGYNPDADWDRDGTVTTRDVAQYGSTAYVTALPQGQLAPAASVSAPLSAANARSDFNIGFSGYRFNGDIGAYTVRFRHYDPTPGMCRWLERDPAGYQDGPSLYSYLGRNPMAGTDPYGLYYRGWWDDMKEGFGALREYWGSPPTPSQWWEDTTEGYGALPIYLNSPFERFMLGVLKGAVTTLVVSAVIVAAPVTAPAFLGLGILLSGWTAWDLWKNPDRYDEGDRWEIFGNLVGGIGTASGVTSPGAVRQFDGRSFRLTPQGPQSPPGSVPVSRWGRGAPTQPGLKQGDWVMRGGPTLLKYILSGTAQPGKHFRPFGNVQSLSVPRSSLHPASDGLRGILKPLGWLLDFVKPYIGQSQYRGDSTWSAGGGAGAAAGG